MVCPCSLPFETNENISSKQLYEYRVLYAKGGKYDLGGSIDAHCTKKKISSSVSKTANMTGGIFATDSLHSDAPILSISGLCAFTQPSSSALEQMD